MVTKNYFCNSGQIFNARVAQEIYSGLNCQYFDGKLPSCHIEISSRLTRTAGKIWPSLRLIRLSVAYHQHYGLEEFRNTILHEMIHLWLHEQGLPSGHTLLFRRKLEEVGLEGRTRAFPLPPRPYKYRYICPSCKCEVFTRRKINSSCGKCDKVFNSRYKFILAERLNLKDAGAA